MNICEEGELVNNAIIRDFRMIHQSRSCKILIKIEHYNYNFVAKGEK